MGTFSVRDLRNRTSELIQDTKDGKLSVITKHGRPIFTAVPFDETLLKEGVHIALAVKLFDDEVISLGKAAKLAGMHQSEFINHLGALKIPVVRYEKEELDQELMPLDSSVGGCYS